MGEGRIADTVIEGVKLNRLKIIEDNRGSVRHMLKRTDPHFRSFGEVYFSTINPGVVKAWHLHKKMTLNYVCVVGRVFVALFDLRPGPTQDFIETHWLSPDKPGEYSLLTIPPGVWNGFRADATLTEPSMIANCASEPHDPEEIERLHPDQFPLYFNWGDYKVAG